MLAGFVSWLLEGLQEADARAGGMARARVSMDARRGSVVQAARPVRPPRAAALRPGDAEGRRRHSLTSTGLFVVVWDLPRDQGVGESGGVVACTKTRNSCKTTSPSLLFDWPLLLFGLAALTPQHALPKGRPLLAAPRRSSSCSIAAAGWVTHRASIATRGADDVGHLQVD